MFGGFAILWAFVICAALCYFAVYWGDHSSSVDEIAALSALAGSALYSPPPASQAFDLGAPRQLDEDALQVAGVKLSS